MATRSRAQGQAIIEYLGKRPAMKNQSLVGKVTAASRFEDTRKNLIERLSTAVDNTLRTNEEEKEKEEVFATLRATAAFSAGLQMGALISALAISFNILEPVPGLIVASCLALGSGTSYFLGTSRVAQTYDAKWVDRARYLDAALVTICDNEVERVSRRIMDGVGPYTRFVESEEDRIATLRDRCEGLAAAAQNLRNRIGRLS